MKILYLHQHFTTPQGKGGTRSYEFAKKLVSRGHIVTVVCGSHVIAHTGLEGLFVRGKRQGVVDGVRVIELQMGYSNYDSFYKRAITFLRFAIQATWIALTSPYDVLFATSTPLTIGIPGIFAKLLRRQKKFIFEVRDLWPEGPQSLGLIKNQMVFRLMSVLERSCYYFADACIGLSPGIVEGIKKKQPKQIVEMIPNGCDLDLFAPPRKNLFDFTAYGISSTDFVAVFAGAHGYANGLSAILDAAKVLKRKGRFDIKLLFIGDGILKSRLKEIAVEEKLDNCIFMDPVPKTQLARLFATAHIGLMTLVNSKAYYYSTSPNKFFDYISAGLPVINNYPGWLAEMIEQNQCGIYVKPENPEAFACALMELVDNKSLLATYGKHARKLAEKTFDRRILAEKFCIFLEEQCIRKN